VRSTCTVGSAQSQTSQADDAAAVRSRCFLVGVAAFSRRVHRGDAVVVDGAVHSSAVSVGCGCCARLVEEERRRGRSRVPIDLVARDARCSGTRRRCPTQGDAAGHRWRAHGFRARDASRILDGGGAACGFIGPPRLNPRGACRWGERWSLAAPCRQPPPRNALPAPFSGRRTFHLRRYCDESRSPVHPQKQ